MKNDANSITGFFVRMVTLSGFGILVIIASLLAYRGRLAVSCGMLVSGFWTYLSGWLLSRLFLIVQNPGRKPGLRVFWLLVLKFPVLYLCGYMILRSRLFPPLSIVAGLSIFVFAFTFSWFLVNWHLMRQLKGAK